MKDLVEYMAKELVDEPDRVNVSLAGGSHSTIIKLRVAPNDKGWVIGRRGRVANAMRTLVRVAAMTEGRRRAILEIV